MRWVQICNRKIRRSRRPRSNGTAGALAILCLALILMACGVGGLAGPAAPIVFELEQPDGTTFQARVVGDEWGHWTETIDGYTVVQNEATGTWVYAVADPNGTLVAGSQPVGEGAPPASASHLQPIGAAQAPPIVPPSSQVPSVSHQPPWLGTHQALVLVVDFDTSTLVEVSAAASAVDWNSKFFGASNSIDDYLDEVSYGQLRLSPATESQGTANDGVVFVTLNRVHPNPASLGDANRQIVRDAIIAADPFVNYSSFDLNADGFLSNDELHVVTIVAGYEGGFSTSCGSSVWAHRSALDSPGGTVVTPLVDGVYVCHWSGGPSGTKGGYTQLGEWHCISGGSYDPGHAGTIGTIAHELGHDLGDGVPDLYDTDKSSAGIGEWCLQGSGNWNMTTLPGDTPAHWSAWAKWYLDLLTPTWITTNTNDTSFPRVADATGVNRGVYGVGSNPSGVDWVFYVGSGTGEYFLIENRQQFGYDAGLPGSGLCIWHINEAAPDDNSANADEGTTAPGNDATNPRLVAMEQRDGNFDLEGYGGTNYNGQNNRGDTTDPWVSSNQFTDGSTPNSRLYSGASTWVNVIDISASGATMTADIQFGPPATAAVFRVASDGTVLADGTVYGANFLTGAADVAEWVRVSEPVEAGDVLELDPDNPQHYRKSTGACSSLVAGVVSTQPGVVLGSSAAVHSSPLTDHAQALLALVGIVPVKVCNEGGTIGIGDLLIAAAIPGYAKKWDAESGVLCPLVGKALEEMTEETGTILVLLMR